MTDELINSMGTLSNWLEKYNWKIWYNQKNRDNRPIFHANTNSKPDMLISKKGTNILIEVKPGDKHQDILDGYQQTINYAGEYHIGRAIYKTEEESNLKIDAFVLATNYSISGFLYNDEESQSWMDNSYLKKELNLVEKPITHSITRLMWRQWEKGIPNKYYKTMKVNKLAEGIKCPSKKPKVGSLLARVDRKYRLTGDPYLFINNNNFVDISKKGFHNVFN